MISPTHRPLPHNTQHSRQTSIPLAGFETALPTSELSRTTLLTARPPGSARSTPQASKCKEYHNYNALSPLRVPSPAWFGILSTCNISNTPHTVSVKLQETPKQVPKQPVTYQAVTQDTRTPTTPLHLARRTECVKIMFNAKYRRQCKIITK